MLYREFAGVERAFRLRYGDIMDLETACGEVGIASIYRAFGTFDWRIGHVAHVLRIGLVGGGMRADEARRIVTERIDAGQIGDLMALAFDVLIDTLDGAPKAEAGSAGDGPDKPIDRGLVYKAFAETGIAPQQVDEMAFAQVLHLYGAMAKAGSGGKVAPPTAEDAAELRARVASGDLDWSLQPTVKGA